ncbi:endonuclease/exonuclease/phosphatase family protein [Brachybacterium sp. AOP35-5H-19]|uniref:endonuclease/exonuclease/phosphatase family protein n=1 Tax=Brachybacterium sp. AOP35-5H-19 TaxID=3457685 RepID=UPI0040333FCE
MSTWRVATYNIRHGLGDDGRVDLARTAREIAALDAEVIGLQEVDQGFGPRSGHEDQAARLGELLGMQVCFGAALELPPAREDEPPRRYGLALLTRHEIPSHSLALLPAHPGCAPPTEPRGVLHARIRGPGEQELDVLVTHLDNASRAHRTAQVQRIVRHAADLTGPALLMGDMNADPSTPELAALAATGWRDAAQEAGSGDGASTVRGVTSTQRGNRRSPIRAQLDVAMTQLRSLRLATHPARFPVRRIDSLWVRGEIEVSNVEVGARRSSDHRPVAATVHMTRRGAGA